MKSNISDTNYESQIPPKKRPWYYPPDRVWIEFSIIVTLLAVCAASMVSLIVSASEAKHARIVAVNRLEVIYDSLMRSEEELKELKIIAMGEERVFHSQLNSSIKVRDTLLKRIACQVGVPVGEVDEILKKDPIH